MIYHTKLNMVKKIIVIFAVVILLFNVGINCFALELQSADLVKIGNADQHLQYFREDRGYSTPIVCSIVGYYNKSGTFFPAYCMNKDLPGAETSEYTVNINSLINNDAVWRVVKNGWPYKSAAEMGLSNDFDAYAVTKFAVYCVLGESNLSYYSAIPGDSTGEQMMNVLNNLVNIGFNGTDTKSMGTMSVSKVNGFLDANGYYYQDYKVSSSVNMSQFIVSISNLPEGTYVADIRNSAKNTFSNGEIFRILVPTDKLTSNLNGTINILGKCETYPIFYGEAPAGMQNYVVTYGTYGDENISTDLNISTNTGSLKVIKIDDETEIPIEGVSFTLKSEDGSYEATGVTDSNGVLNFNNLYQGKYILTEVETGENYILDEIKDNVITINYNENSEIIIGNTIKRGKIKVIKTDSETNKPISGVEFNIINKDTGQILETIKTDENGEAQSSDLRVDINYVLKEVKTLEEYILSEEEISFNVLDNEIIEINVENEVKKGKVKIIKTDFDTGEALKGVEFNIIDSSSGEVIETLVTDENGEAQSSDLRVDKNYILQEVKTLENYILNEEKITFKVIDNDISEIKLTNQKQPEIEKEEIKVLPKTGF